MIHSNFQDHKNWRGFLMFFVILNQDKLKLKYYLRAKYPASVRSIPSNANKYKTLHLLGDYGEKKTQEE